jgi:hypothetical protein
MHARHVDDPALGGDAAGLELRDGEIDTGADRGEAESRLMNNLLLEATRLTRASRLTEATAVIQRVGNTVCSLEAFF